MAEDITTLLNREMAKAVQEEMDKDFLRQIAEHPLVVMKEAIDNGGVPPVAAVEDRRRHRLSEVGDGLRLQTHGPGDDEGID